MNRRHFITSTGAAVALAPAILSAQTTPARIRIGQIGTRHAHAAGKLAAIRNLPELYDLVGIVEPDEMRRAALQKDKTYENVPWLTEEQLLNTKGLQVVDVETEVKDLVPTGTRCVAMGMHIHLDKPAGESLPAFKRLLDEATKGHRTVQMGYMFRYNPAFQLCYRAVKEGWLGNVFAIETCMGKVLDARSRAELVPYRGGSIFELGCHVIDSVVKILGRPERVTAHGRSSGNYTDGFLDNQLAVLDYPKATVTVRSAMIEVEGGLRRQFVVCGDKGTVDIRPLEPPKAKLALDQPRENYKKGYQDVTFPNPPRYDAEFIDLAKVVRGEKQFEWSPEHDLAVHETILLASGLKTT